MRKRAARRRSVLVVVAIAALLEACGTSGQGATPCVGSQRPNPVVSLAAIAPTPTLTVRSRTEFTVRTPGWGRSEPAAAFTVVNPRVISAKCTTLLPNGSRVSVMKALAPGQSYVGSSPTGIGGGSAIPAWSAKIVVTK
jgi:hypothetical protein